MVRPNSVGRIHVGEVLLRTHSGSLRVRVRRRLDGTAGFRRREHHRKPMDVEGQTPVWPDLSRVVVVSGMFTVTILGPWSFQTKD